MSTQESMIGREIICAETGKRFIGAVVGCTTNYASDGKGNYFSDEGVNLRERRELLDRSKPFTGYISSDGRHFTGCKGNILGTVISCHRVNLPRWSYVHGDFMLSYRIRDIHGGLWYGRSSPGICINIRPMKG